MDRRAIVTEAATLPEHPDLSAPTPAGARTAALADAREARPAPSLKRLALVGSVWTLAGYGASQVVRFVTNVALAHLLFPEAMGLMAMVGLVLQGLQMFSDLGIQQSIIQDRRGVDRDFLNTAWTIHVVRGVILSAAAAALAWPLAQVWKMPELARLIPIAGVTATIAGLASTKLFTLNRELALARLTIVELATQLVSTALTVVFAWQLRSVWALVWGALLAAALKTVLSHVALPGAGNRFRWDREAARSIVRFGRWIFISSVLGFFVSRGDRAILGRYFTEAEIGVYSIAFMMSALLMEVVQVISDRVFFPVYVRLKDRPTDELRRKTAQIRLAILGTVAPGAVALVVLGPWLIEHIFDARYHEAGWMLRTLAAGALVSIIPATPPIYLAFGDSKVLTVLVASRAALLMLCMAAGGVVGGMAGGGATGAHQGLVVGVAATNLLHYPFNIWSLRRYGVWIGRLDLAGFVGAGALVALGIWLVG